MKTVLEIIVALLVALSMSSCKVYQIDASTLSEADRAKLIQQNYNSHVRIQSGWIQNPFYWDNGYYGNWNGWNNYNRFQSPAIIIKRQPNKRNGRNNNTGYRGANRPTKPVQNRLSKPVVKPKLPTRVRGRRGQKQ